MEFQQQNNINEPQPIACDRRNRVAIVSLSGTQPCPLAGQELSGWRLLVPLGRSRPPDLLLKGKENPWPRVTCDRFDHSPSVHITENKALFKGVGSF